MMRRSHCRTFARYQLVHIRPDGTRRPTMWYASDWRDAVAAGERLTAMLRAEVRRGYADSAGMIEIVDTWTDTLVQTRPILPPDPDHG
jgi:hypothetical protein